MRKLYLLVSLLALMALCRGESYAAPNYFPGTATISAPANYCVGAAAVPMTGTITMSSCAGAFTAMSLNCYWYYNTVNSTSILTATLVSTSTAFATTTAAGTSIAVPPYTPSTAIAGLYYYFCIIKYPPSICNTDTVLLASNTNQIVVGAPVFTLASLTPNPICGNDSVFFNAVAAGGTTYQWYGPGTSGFATGAAPPPFVVNVADAGVYTITSTNACGTSTANVTLTINSPITSVTASAPTPATFCATGGSFTLTGTVTGGTGVSYMWQGPGGYTSTLLSPTVTTPTGSNSGLYTLTATPGGCPPVSATTAYIQVDEPVVLSTVDISPNPVCTNHLVTLSDVQLYGTQFLWTGPNGYTSTLQNPPPFLDSPLDAGVYTLTVSNSCNSMTGTTPALTVNMMPSLITGHDTNICAEPGVLSQFFDTTIGGIWSSSATSIATVNTVGGITGISNGTAIIYFTTANGCYDSVIVHIGRPPTFIGGSESVCVGDSTQLTDGAPGGIWSSPNSTVLVDHGDGYVTGVSAGSATITYATPGCPPVTYSISVLAAPLPITGQLSLCLGTTSTISDNSGNGTWSVSDPTISPVAPISTTSAVLDGLHVGVDTVYYTAGSNSCRVYATVIVDSLPPISVFGPNQICYGECATLTVTNIPAAVYLWDSGYGISCTNCDSVLACPKETQTYTVTVSNAAHCVSTTVHKLQVNPLPGITYSPDPFYMCLGTPKQINATDSIPSNNPDTYHWYPNVYINNNNIPDPVFSDSIDLVYTVVATSQFGCKDSIRVPVSVLDPASTSISQDTIICIGQSHHITATSTDPRSLFSWYIVDSIRFVSATTLDNTNTAEVTATPSYSTTYACIITENACFVDTLYTTVFVDPLPAVAIAEQTSGGGTGAIIAGSSITLTANITNMDTGLVYEWTPVGTVSCPSCASTIVTPDSNTEYHVCVMSNRGCVSCDSISVTMFCDKAQIFVPNTFTPNGDGFNDRFMVSGEGLGLIHHFTVYNRWGEVVFDESYVPANDATYGWNGTYKGQILEPDVFMWVLEVGCETQGATFKLHGDISLVR